MSILVITTGGTIGALPYEHFNYSLDFVSTMPPDGQDLVRNTLDKNFAFFKTRCISHKPIDSKLMDKPYRQELLKIIETAPENQILITHGTDTLLQTAEFFHKQCATEAMLADKNVVITGAMVPLANGPESDGYLNLEFSLKQLDRFATEAKNERCGVYVVLCDYEVPEDETSTWKPHLYPFQPGRYEKIYCEDRRYSRLRRVEQNA